MSEPTRTELMELIAERIYHEDMVSWGEAMERASVILELEDKKDNRGGQNGQKGQKKGRGWGVLSVLIVRIGRRNPDEEASLVGEDQGRAG